MRLNPLPLVLVACPLALAACDGDDTVPTLPDDGGASTDGALADGTVATDGSLNADGSDGSPTTDGASPPADGGPVDATTLDAADAGPSALLRVAWFDDPAYTPALGASMFDFCLAPTGTQSWTGPVLTAAGGTGLTLGDVSAYLHVPVGEYDVRIVPIDADTGTPTCARLTAPTLDAGPDAAADAGEAVAPVTDFGNLPEMTDGRALTLVFTPPFTSTAPGSIADLVPLIDETSTDTGMVGVRFANVSGTASAGALDYGLGGGVTFLPLFEDVTATDHLDPSADLNGYVQIDPFTGLDTSIQQGGVDLGVSAGFDAVAGSRISSFALLVAQPGGGVAPGLVACEDGVPNTTNPLLGSCNAVSVVPPGALSGVATRFADFIADPGFTAVDVCVKYDFQPTWTGSPLLGPASPGLVAGQVTKRFSVHPGALFDVRLVAAGSTTCTAAVTPDVTYFPPSTASELATVAITGWEAPPDDAGVGFPDGSADANAGGGVSSLFVTGVTLEDLACHETAPVVRVAHMAGVDPVPLTASLDSDAGAGWSFPEVPYGGFLTDVPHDACGYLSVGSQTGGVLAVAGARWTYSVAPTTTGTLYLYSAGGQVNVLACDDSDPTAAACAPLVAAP